MHVIANSYVLRVKGLVPRVKGLASYLNGGSASAAFEDCMTTDRQRLENSNGVITCLLCVAGGTIE